MAHEGAGLLLEVIYRDVWPGIDLRVYGNGPNLEQEFIVRPGGDLSVVQVAYRGVDKLSISGDGSLDVATSFGVLRETKPRIFQQVAGKRNIVEGRYNLTSPTSYSFEAGSSDTLYSLVIDPTLLYSTFLGGSSANEVINGIAVDASGSAYVAGYTASTDFPTTMGSFQLTPDNTPLGATTAFITKLNATGSELVYSTYFGSVADITAIAVDSVGQSYVTGYTTNGLPTTANAYWPTDPSQPCTADFFVTMLNTTGDKLVYSSCFNAHANEGVGFGYLPRGIAVDSNGKAFIAGGIVGGGLPTTATAYQSLFPGGSSAFVTVFDTTSSGASSLVYSTYLGPTSSSSNSNGYAVNAIDSYGKIYITGSALGGFPVTSGALSNISFVLAFDGRIYRQARPFWIGSSIVNLLNLPGRLWLRKVR